MSVVIAGDSSSSSTFVIVQVGLIDYSRYYNVVSHLVSICARSRFKTHLPDIPIIGSSNPAPTSHHPSCQFLAVRSFSIALKNPRGCVLSSKLNGKSGNDAKADISSSGMLFAVGSTGVAPVPVSIGLCLSSQNDRDTLFSALIVFAKGARSVRYFDASVMAAPTLSRSWMSSLQSSGLVQRRMCS